MLWKFREIVNNGNSVDNSSFKQSDWVEVANYVRPHWDGPATLAWENCKSKFTDKYKKLWSKWLEHSQVLGLSGWGINEKGLPVTNPEVMDQYFTARPEFKDFRHNLPDGYEYLVVILSNNSVATGSNARGFNEVEDNAHDSDDARDTTAGGTDEDSEGVNKEDDITTDDIKRSSSVLSSATSTSSLSPALVLKIKNPRK